MKLIHILYNIAMVHIFRIPDNKDFQRTNEETKETENRAR